MPKKKIFISLVAFMDDELENTLNNIYKTAKDPKRVFVGVYNMDDRELKYKNKNVTIVTKHPSEIDYGRCRAETQTELYNNEDYYMQIAPHSRLVQDWDEKFIEEYKKQKGKVVLCGLPMGYEEDGTLGIDAHKYSKPLNFARHLGVRVCPTKFKNKKPFEVFFMNAGCIFTTGEWLKDVPYDPYVVLWGEETDLSMRTYLKGWKMMNLSSMLVYHLYKRKKRRGMSETFDKTFNHRVGLGALRVRIKLGQVEKDNFYEAEEEFDKYYIDGSKYREKVEEVMND